MLIITVMFDGVSSHWVRVHGVFTNNLPSPLYTTAQF
ncbi:Uncharacterised protein [Escherichia coli]|nr:Uncharacterised protein [Escherichia coli]